MITAGSEVLLMVAPTGAHLSKAEAPGLPVTPEELAAEAAACKVAGAAALHLHVRDEQGRHTLDFMRYGEAIHAPFSESGSKARRKSSSISGLASSPPRRPSTNNRKGRGQPIIPSSHNSATRATSSGA